MPASEGDCPWYDIICHFFGDDDDDSDPPPPDESEPDNGDGDGDDDGVCMQLICSEYFDADGALVIECRWENICYV